MAVVFQSQSLLFLLSPSGHATDSRAETKLHIDYHADDGPVLIPRRCVGSKAQRDKKGALVSATPPIRRAAAPRLGLLSNVEADWLGRER